MFPELLIVTREIRKDPDFHRNFSLLQECVRGLCNNNLSNFKTNPIIIPSNQYLLLLQSAGLINVVFRWLTGISRGFFLDKQVSKCRHLGSERRYSFRLQPPKLYIYLLQHYIYFVSMK